MVTDQFFRALHKILISSVTRQSRTASENEKKLNAPTGNDWRMNAAERERLQPSISAHILVVGATSQPNIGFTVVSSRLLLFDVPF